MLAFALGLRLALVNNFKPSEEEERKCVVLSVKIIYHNHGKAVPVFCRAWQPDFGQFFRLTLFLGYQAQLGGRKLLVSIYYYHGLIWP